MRSSPRQMLQRERKAHNETKAQYDNLLRNWKQEIVKSAQLERLYERSNENLLAFIQGKPVDKSIGKL